MWIRDGKTGAWQVHTWSVSPQGLPWLTVLCRPESLIELSLMMETLSICTRNMMTTSHMWRRRQWHRTPVLWPGKSHGQRSLVDCSPWGPKELDTTERLHFHFSLSCIGEGNGNPLQCSCLENLKDGGARWTAIYGVAQSQTRLKWLSGSSSSSHMWVVIPWNVTHVAKKVSF